MLSLSNIMFYVAIQVIGVYTLLNFLA